MISTQTLWSQYLNIKRGDGECVRIKTNGWFSVHTDAGRDSAGLSSSAQNVSLTEGIREVEGGMVVALLKCFPKHRSVKRATAPEAE